MADEEDRIRRCVREELELNLVSRTRNLIHSAASSSVPELNNVFAGQTAQRSSFGSSSRPTVKRQNILGPLHVVLLRTETQRRIQKGCRGCSQVLSWNKNKPEQELCFQSSRLKGKMFSEYGKASYTRLLRVLISQDRDKEDDISASDV